jgi:phosphoribosyl-AMP cyclohydrolase / phosphoribosyl-ATP pyrophosphohydrolase
LPGREAGHHRHRERKGRILSEGAVSPAKESAEPSELLACLKFDSNELIVAVAQDHLSGDVLMVAWMDRAAVTATLQTGKATFFSRSRQRQWVKGETSGHWLLVQSVHVDCDGDTLLLRVSPSGPSCHTGRPTCFFKALSPATEGARAPGSFLGALEDEIRERAQSSTAAKSYTRTLIEGGADKIGAKLREEADELSRAVAAESPERVASEAADVLYHVLVGLRSRGVAFSDVLAVLNSRAGVSGLVEKARRGGA